MVCKSVRSGKKPAGMSNEDPLLDLDMNLSWKEQPLVVGVTIAELLGGYLTSIDEKDPKGFYFCDKSDISSFISIDEFLKFDWVQDKSLISKTGNDIESLILLLTYKRNKASE